MPAHSSRVLENSATVGQLPSCRDLHKHNVGTQAQKEVGQARLRGACATIAATASTALPPPMIVQASERIKQAHQSTAW